MVRGVKRALEEFAAKEREQVRLHGLILEVICYFIGNGSASRAALVQFVSGRFGVQVVQRCKRRNSIRR